MIILKRRKEEFFLVAEIGLTIFNTRVAVITYLVGDYVTCAITIGVIIYHLSLIKKLIKDLRKK